MSSSGDAIDSHDIVVIKFGSGILATLDGLSLDHDQIARLATEVATQVKRGRRCVVVSSGAVAAGLMELGLHQRPAELAAVQACSAIGQSRLMLAYERAFGAHDLVVGQLLLTHQDLDSRIRYNNARNTLARLFDYGVVPIINENDSVAVEELRFGDNDYLSAEVAELCNARLLLLLTSVDGLTSSTDGSGEVIRVVADIDSVRGLAGANAGARSVGGMSSKLQAVGLAVKAGIDAVIANGRTPGVIAAALDNEPVGTLFPGRRPKEVPTPKSTSPPSHRDRVHDPRPESDALTRQEGSRP